MLTEEQLKGWILNKMKRYRLVGGKHTDIKNIRKGAPLNFYSEIDELVNELIKQGFIIVKVTSYGKHVSLNPRLLKDIDDFIQKHYTEETFGVPR